jgi:hypothetical protein
MAPKKASQFILIEALNELFIEALNNLLMITFYFLVFSGKGNLEKIPQNNGFQRIWPNQLNSRMKTHKMTPKELKVLVKHS